MGPTAERLAVTAAKYREKQTPSDADLDAAFMQQPTELSASSQPPWRPSEVPVRTRRTAELLMHRRSDMVLATAFNPARHSIMVIGRPVQVGVWPFFEIADFGFVCFPLATKKDRSWR